MAKPLAFYIVTAEVRLLARDHKDALAQSGLEQVTSLLADGTVIRVAGSGTYRKTPRDLVVKAGPTTSYPSAAYEVLPADFE